MTTKTTYSIIGFLILASIVIGAYIYPTLPAQIASHWGADGNVNGYMPKFWGVFLFPLIMIFMSMLLAWLPSIDPMKENVEQFRKQYNGIILFIAAFMFYVFLLSISWNIGYRFNMTQFLIPALAALFYFLGVALPKTKQNWFMGIRTPWTLSSPVVWEETHVFGGKLFKITGVLALAGLAFPSYIIWFIMIPVFVSAFGTIIYSYYSFKRESRL